MSYVTSIERFAIEKGELIGEARGEIKGEIRGEAIGEINTLLKQLTLKFGMLPKSIEQKVVTASKAQLDMWIEKILTADSLQSLFDLRQ